MLAIKDPRKAKEPNSMNPNYRTESQNKNGSKLKNKIKIQTAMNNSAVNAIRIKKIAGKPLVAAPASPEVRVNGRTRISNNQPGDQKRTSNQVFLKLGKN